MCLVNLAFFIRPFSEVLESGGVRAYGYRSGEGSVLCEDSYLSLVDSDDCYESACKVVGIDSLVVFVARCVESDNGCNLRGLTGFVRAVSEGYDKVSGLRLI